MTKSVEDPEISIEGLVSCTMAQGRQRTHDCVRPLVLGPEPEELSRWEEENSHPEHSFCSPGTSHLLKYRGHYFALFTRHQVLTSSGEVIGHPYVMELEAGKISSRQTFQSIPHGDDPQEQEDIAAVVIDEVIIADCPSSEVHFFPLADSIRALVNVEQEVWTTIGYPAKHSSYDLETSPPTFHRSCIEIFCQPNFVENGEVEHVFKASVCPMTDNSLFLDGDFDGLSGSPVFAWSSLRQDLRYRGMVVRGGHDKLRIVSDSFVRVFLDRVIDRFPTQLIRDEPK